jgi:hypothetical protein
LRIEAPHAGAAHWTVGDGGELRRVWLGMVARWKEAFRGRHRFDRLDGRNSEDSGRHELAREDEAYPDHQSLFLGKLHYAHFD